MVLTDNEHIAERLRLVRNLFFSPKKRYVHEELGEGLYDMCFVSGEKICYVVQLKLTKQPAE